MKRRDFLKITALGTSAAAVTTLSWLSPKWSWAAPTSDLNAPIALNQLGYLPKAKKLATLRVPSSAFTVRALKGNHVALRGKPEAVRDDAASGDRVQIADLSALHKPGQYILEIDGAKSTPFEIGDHVYRDALRLTMRSYYGQRCGCNVDLSDGYSHPACHLDAAFHETSGKSGALKNHGGCMMPVTTAATL
jgi:endoglucanase